MVVRLLPASGYTHQQQARQASSSQSERCTLPATTLIWLPSQADAQRGGLSKPSHPPTEGDTWVHSDAECFCVGQIGCTHPPALQQHQCRAPQKCTSGTSLKTGRRLNVHPSPLSLPSSHSRMQKSTCSLWSSHLVGQIG